MNNAGMVYSLASEGITFSQADDESIDNSLGAGATAITKRFSECIDEVTGAKRHKYTTVDNGVGMSSKRLFDSLQYFSRLKSAARRVPGADAAGTSMFGAGLWVLVSGFLNHEDEKDAMRILTTVKGSDDIWGCDLNLNDYCQQGAPRFFRIVGEGCHGIVANFLKLLEECNALGDEMKITDGANPLDGVVLSKTCADFFIPKSPGEDLRGIDFSEAASSSAAASISQQQFPSLRDAHGTLIHFDTGKNISKEAIEVLKKSIRHTYYTDDQVLPIFIQEKAKARWSALKPCLYIEKNLRMLIVRCELNVETGIFYISNLVQRIKGRSYPIPKTAKLFQNLKTCVKDCGYNFPFKGLQPDSSIGNPYFELRICYETKFQPGKYVFKKVQSHLLKSMAGFVSNAYRSSDSSFMSGTSLTQCEGVRVMLPLGKGERMAGRIVPMGQAPSSKLFQPNIGKFPKENGIRTRYPWKLGFMIRCELLVSPSLQRGRLPDIAQIKSRSMGLNENSYERRAFKTLIFSLIKLLLPGKKVKKKHMARAAEMNVKGKAYVQNARIESLFQDLNSSDANILLSGRSESDSSESSASDESDESDESNSESDSDSSSDSNESGSSDSFTDSGISEDDDDDKSEKGEKSSKVKASLDPVAKAAREKDLLDRRNDNKILLEQAKKLALFKRKFFPKKPAHVFELYKNDVFTTVRSQNPHLSKKFISKLIRIKWKSLGEEDLLKWKHVHEDRMRLYKNELKTIAEGPFQDFLRAENIDCDISILNDIDPEDGEDKGESGDEDSEDSAEEVDPDGNSNIFRWNNQSESAFCFGLLKAQEDEELRIMQSIKRCRTKTGRNEQYAKLKKLRKHHESVCIKILQELEHEKASDDGLGLTNFNYTREGQRIEVRMLVGSGNTPFKKKWVCGTILCSTSEGDLVMYDGNTVPALLPHAHKTSDVRYIPDKQSNVKTKKRPRESSSPKGGSVQDHSLLLRKWPKKIRHSLVNGESSVTLL